MTAFPASASSPAQGANAAGASSADERLASAARINAALPQTQCTRCGFPDCAAYAQAIASEGAAINQCPPGGAEGVQRLAALTGQPVLPLNPANGQEGPRTVAVIDEAWCIGCTLCIKACPTDAILGSNKAMHTVIEPWCTGCELCVPVCPVDCISLENISGARTGWQAWSQGQADTAKTRYAVHTAHTLRTLHAPESAEAQADAEDTDEPAPTAPSTPTAMAQAADTALPVDRKRAMIDAALARARAQRNIG